MTRLRNSHFGSFDSFSQRNLRPVVVKPTRTTNLINMKKFRSILTQRSGEEKKDPTRNIFTTTRLCRTHRVILTIRRTIRDCCITICSGTIVTRARVHAAWQSVHARRLVPGSSVRVHRGTREYTRRSRESKLVRFQSSFVIVSCRTVARGPSKPDKSIGVRSHEIETLHDASADATRRVR